jgi:hypothetical protein
MSASMSDLETRVRAALYDGAGLVYDGLTLDEAIRMALGHYNLAGGGQASIAGLDGAETTTLPALHESLVVCGAAAYAAQARAAEQASRAVPESDPAGLRDWASERMREYLHLLALVFPLSGEAADAAAGAIRADQAAGKEAARLNALRTSGDVPWRAWIDAEE